MSKKTFCRITLLLLLFSGFTNTTAQNNLFQQTLDNPAFEWISIESGNIRIYYQKDSYAEKHRMMFMRSVEQSVDEVLNLLEESESERLLNVFYVESREEMEKIMGRPVTGFAAWGVNAIFLVVNAGWRSFEKHEFAHIVTMGRWGSPAASSRWMIEGISIHCDGWCREYTVDEVAYSLLTRGELPSLQKLFDNYADLGEIKAGFYAGSFIGFIHDKYEIEFVRDLWEEGTGNLETLLGENIEQIEVSWQQYLEKNVNKEIKVDLKIINDKGCG